jgi:hypothetical protein
LVADKDEEDVVGIKGRKLLHPWPPAKVAVDVSTNKRTEPGRRRGKPLCLGDIDL